MRWPRLSASTGATMRNQARRPATPLAGTAARGASVQALCRGRGGARACSRVLASLPPPAPPGTTLQPPAYADRGRAHEQPLLPARTRPTREDFSLAGPCASDAPRRTSAAAPPRPPCRAAARERGSRPACAGRCSEAERDRIEEQVGAYVRSCTEHIARLEQGAAAEPTANPHVVAHRHGAVRSPWRRPARRASAAAASNAVPAACPDPSRGDVRAVLVGLEPWAVPLPHMNSPAQAIRACCQGGSAPPTAGGLKRSSQEARRASRTGEPIARTRRRSA